MLTSVNNCIIQCQKGHIPNEKRAYFLVFDKSEPTCPNAPHVPRPMVLVKNSLRKGGLLLRLINLCKGAKSTYLKKGY